MQRAARSRLSAQSDVQWNEAKALLEANPPVPVACFAKLLSVARHMIYTRMKREREKAEAAA